MLYSGPFPFLPQSPPRRRTLRNCLPSCFSFVTASSVWGVFVPGRSLSGRPGLGRPIIFPLAFSKWTFPTYDAPFSRDAVSASFWPASRREPFGWCALFHSQPPPPPPPPIDRGPSSLEAFSAHDAGWGASPVQQALTAALR